MIRIMVMNGLLISLILIWTSAAKEPSAGYLIKSSTKPPTGPLNYSVSKPMVSLHETNKEILRRKFLCGSELGGVCVNKKKSCPSNLPSEKSPGKPYCSKKKDRCCYPDPTTAAPPTVVPTTTTTSEDVNWSDIRNACIKSNNYKTYQPLALDICKEKCVEEDAINCQSIEYSSAQQICAISEARSDSEDFIEPCHVDGWVFAEIELNAGPTTGAPTTLVLSNTTINGQTTNPPTTTAPSNTTNNVSSCNLVWNYEEDRPLIMIRETKTIVPPIIDIEISEDPNRIPEGKKLIFACPGENNQFNHVQGTHTKLHGECISHEQFKVCVNNYPEILDLSQLSCSSKMQPSIIKQDNDTSYEKSCEDIGGELYKFGYIYGDYREFKDLDTKFCFREKDQTTLWTSTNIDRIEISPSMRSMDPANFRTARGLAMNTFYSQKSQQETLKEILDKEVTSVWNDKACRNHGGHCVRGGRPCPKHLPHHTSQGEPFCTSFYRCCYSDQCDPSTCTYKGKKGNCSLDYLPGTTGVGSQECKKGCQCYIKNNKTLLQFKSLQERKELSKLLRVGKCGEGGGASFCNSQNLKFHKTLPNPMQREFKDCKIVWSDDYEGFAPLIFSGNCITPQIIRHDYVMDGDMLLFTCPDDSNSFKYGTGRNTYITCSDGKLEPVEIKYLGCETWVRATIKPERKNPTESHRCGAKNIGTQYEIGFEAHFPNDIKFFSLIYVCFNKNKQTTLMTKHTLSYLGKSDNNNPPDFRTSTGFFTVAMKIYTQRSQAFLFSAEKLNLKEELVCNPKYPNTYLQRGHMAPKGDFVTKAEQDATFYYINALPQWSTINNGNWKGIEDSIRGLKMGFDLTIYTGGYGELHLENKSPTLVPVYLSNVYDIDNKQNKVPVPAYTWKVVHAVSLNLNQAVAFMVSNNPFITASPQIPNNIESQCGSLSRWLKGIDDSSFSKGWIGCFTVQDFNTAFSDIGFNSLGNADDKLLV